MMESNLQLSLHAPHLVHFAGSIVWTSFFTPVAAFVGQTFAQRVQPVHFSGSML
jgi:hypothetical protein